MRDVNWPSQSLTDSKSFPPESGVHQERQRYQWTIAKFYLYYWKFLNLKIHLKCAATIVFLILNLKIRLVCPLSPCQRTTSRLHNGLTCKILQYGTQAGGNCWTIQDHSSPRLINRTVFPFVKRNRDAVDNDQEILENSLPHGNDWSEENNILW